VLNFYERILRREVPLSQLADYVTQQSNPGNVKNLAYAESVPVEILRRGFLVDIWTRVFNCREHTNDRALPAQADAFVLVTSYEATVGEEDRIFTGYASRTRGSSSWSQAGYVSAEEQKQPRVYCRAHDRFSFSEKPYIFSLSARQGLYAKQSGIVSIWKKADWIV